MILNKLKNWLTAENGAYTIWFALSFIILLAAVTMVVDYGRPSFEARKLQNAADSAALAASQELPLPMGANASKIRAAAYEYAEKNGFSDRNNISVELGSVAGGQYLKVTVTIRNTVNYAIAPLFGIDCVDLERSAAVELTALGGVRDCVPLAIKKDVFEFNLASGSDHMILKYGAGDGKEGDYGAIDPDDSGGANQYKEWLKYGYDGVLYVGGVISVESGNMAGPTREGILYRWNQCRHNPPCSPAHYEPDCPRVMVVPIVHSVGKKVLQIDGFAAFFLNPTVGNGKDSEVHATYIPGYVADGEVTAKLNPYGVYGRKIVQ